MATARLKGKCGEGGRPAAWSRGMAAWVRSPLVGVPSAGSNQPTELWDVKNHREEPRARAVQRGFTLIHTLSRQNAL